MDFVNFRQVELPDLLNNHFDLVIAASGYETRSISFFNDNQLNAAKKVAFAFCEKSLETTRKYNDKAFIEKGFDLIQASGEDHNVILNFLKLELRKIQKEKINILIDYSSMTRKWYAAIIHFLVAEQLECNKLHAYFTYTPAQINLTRKDSSILYAESVLPVPSFRHNNLPLTLIIGIGINSDKATHLIKKLNPDHLVLLYADPGFERSFVETVLKNNHKLIESVEIRHIVNYPAHDIEKTYQILKDICFELRAKHNIIIAHLGPKVLSFSSILLNISYPYVDIWKVQSKEGKSALDRIPIAKPVNVVVNFTHDDE
jgi:hypothetical protein